MEIFKCRVLMTRPGHSAHYDVDLVFLSSLPTLVVEWRPAQPEDIPALTIPLDPRFLHEMKGWGSVTHLYERPVEDPRPLH
jgi:hypothetical protein